MDSHGFNPDDIEDIVSRHRREQKKALRSTTAGIPDFVPRKVAHSSRQSTVASMDYGQDDALWSAAADRAAQQNQESLPPVTPCFSQADIDEFLARRPQKYEMTERDYKELGRNLALGVGDLIVGSVQAVSLVLATAHDPHSQTEDGEEWKWGTEGYGLYSGGTKICGVD